MPGPFIGSTKLPTNVSMQDAWREFGEIVEGSRVEHPWHTLTDPVCPLPLRIPERPSVASPFGQGALQDSLLQPPGPCQPSRQPFGGTWSRMPWPAALADLLPQARRGADETVENAPGALDRQCPSSGSQVGSGTTRADFGDGRLAMDPQDWEEEDDCDDGPQFGAVPGEGCVPPTVLAGPAPSRKPPAVDPRVKAARNIAEAGGGLSGCTTVMVRHVPCKYSQRKLMREINSNGFLGKYDFFYLPMDPRGHANRGFAFVNLNSDEIAEAFYRTFHGQKFCHFNTDKAVSVLPADLQGFEHNAAHYAASRTTRQRRTPQNRPLFFRPLPAHLLADEAGGAADSPPSASALASAPASGAVAPWAAPAADVPAPAASEATSSGSADVRRRFCVFCGQPTQGQFHFCPYCGNRAVS